MNKTKNIVSKVNFTDVSDKKTLVCFLYEDEVYMTAVISTESGVPKVFYGAMAFPEACKADTLHLEYKRGRQSAIKITPYIYYFRTKKVQDKIERELLRQFKKEKSD